MLARGGCPMAAQTSKPSHSSEDSVIQIHGVLGGNKNSVMAKVRYTTSKSTPKTMPNARYWSQGMRLGLR
jgi:hypothetical protein